MSSVDAAGTTQAKEDPEAAVREYVRGIPTSASTSASATPTIESRTASSSDLADLTSGGTHHFLYTNNSNLPSAIEEDQVAVLEDSDPVDSWQLVEVGRGLANYNSEQIEKVKRMNRYVNGYCYRTS